MPRWPANVDGALERKSRATTAETLQTYPARLKIQYSIILMHTSGYSRIFSIVLVEWS
jgi:hypothetical protein